MMKFDLSRLCRTIWIIAYRELLRFMQDRPRMVSSFGMPILFLVIFGAGFNRVIGSLTPGVDFLKFIYPGIVCMTVLMTSVFAGLSVVWDREFGFLREVLVAPLSRSGIVLGKALGGATVAMVQGVIMLVLAPIVGVSLTPMLVVKLIPMLLVLAASLSGLGILVAARMRSQQAFHMVMQLLVFPLIFLSGVFFPVNNVPPWLGVISKVNPATYGVDAIRQLFLGTELPGSGVPGNPVPVLGVTVFGHTMAIGEEVLVVGVIGLVLMAAAIWAFSRQE